MTRKSQYFGVIFCFTCFVQITCFARDNTREYWISQLEILAKPVMESLAQDSLKVKMPVCMNQDYQYLEAFGRTFCGVSRWLNISDNSKEDSLREYYRDLAVKGFQNGFNTRSKDFFNIKKGIQPLVDAAYLAQGLLRCPRVWEMLDDSTKIRVVDGFKSLRAIKPYGNNWLLFTSILEAFLYKNTGYYDEHRLLNGVFSFIYGFYVGDGLYGDGNDFVMNYYNSYVIHPMLLDILLAIQNIDNDMIKECLDLEMKRYARYVQLLERQIMSDGTMPVYGRTVTCRIGALHAMAEFVCIVDSIPNLPMGQLRSAMTAVLKRQLLEKDFDTQGFLLIGYQGEQSFLAENYISKGSGYHCATFFLPLGLSPEHPFWLEPDEDWTSRKIYSGGIVEKDVSYIESWPIKKMTKRYYYRYINQSSWLRQRLTLIIVVISLFSLLGFIAGIYIIYMIIRKKLKVNDDKERKY